MVEVDLLEPLAGERKGGGAGGFVSGRGGGVAPKDDESLTQGLAKGERWRFGRYETNTEIFCEVVGDEDGRAEDGRANQSSSNVTSHDTSTRYAELCAERLVLKGDRFGTRLAKRMGTTHALATVFLLGPRCAATAQTATEAVKEITRAAMAGGGRGVFSGDLNSQESTTHQTKRSSAAGTPGETDANNDDTGNTTEHGTEKTEWLLASCASVPPPRHGDASDGGVIIRFAAPNTDAVYRVLRKILAPLAHELGAPPFGERGMA